MTVPTYPAPALLEVGLDLVFPPMCVGCRRVGRWICAECWPSVPWIEDRQCFECSKPSPTVSCVGCSGVSRSLDRLIAVAEFEGAAREAVHTLKFNGRYAIAGMMGRLMAEASKGADVDVIVPVPLHRIRLRERGYDQSALLARSVAKSLARPCRPNALRRCRPTLQQSSLPAHERRSNVAGAFEPRDTWNGEAILLLDDVTTTGATLDAAAAALRRAGAGQITGLVFALAV
jgi:ComF family protein